MRMYKVFSQHHFRLHQCCLSSCRAPVQLGGRVKALAAGRVTGRDARIVLFEEHHSLAHSHNQHIKQEQKAPSPMATLS